jgi:hypothetical protein
MRARQRSTRNNMKNTLDREAFIELLRLYLRTQDFERFAKASNSIEKSRFLFRLIKKINKFEYVLIACENKQCFVNFIPDHIAVRPFSELYDSDLIPDILFFAE